MPFEVMLSDTKNRMLESRDLTRKNGILFSGENQMEGYKRASISVCRPILSYFLTGHSFSKAFVLAIFLPFTHRTVSLARHSLPFPSVPDFLVLFFASDRSQFCFLSDRLLLLPSTSPFLLGKRAFFSSTMTGFFCRTMISTFFYQKKSSKISSDRNHQFPLHRDTMPNGSMRSKTMELHRVTLIIPAH